MKMLRVTFVLASMPRRRLVNFSISEAFKRTNLIHKQ